MLMRRVVEAIATLIERRNLEEAEAFLAAHPLEEARQAIAQTLERLRQDVELRERTQQAIGRWIGAKVAARLLVGSPRRVSQPLLRTADAAGGEDVDVVRIQRHRTISRQGSTAVNVCAGIQGDARERENASFERRGCIESRGGADLPIPPIILTAIGQDNRRARRGREFAPYLENEDCSGAALCVESECSGQLS